MKYACVVLLLFTWASALSQQNGKETRVPCIAYWKKGDEKTYFIKRTRRVTVGNSKFNSEADNFFIDAKITVLDSTAAGYTLRCVWLLPPEIEKDSPMGQAFSVMNGRKFIYKTDDVGSFKELVNWEEVRDFHVNLTKKQYQVRGDTASLRKVIEQTAAILNTREMVEKLMIREIQLFHTPFGMQFSTKDTSIREEITIPIGKTKMPTIHSWRITEVEPDNDNFRLVIHQNIDPAGAPKAIEDALKKFTPSEKETAEEMRKALSSFRIDEFSEYKFVRSTGWFKAFTVTRTTVKGEMNEVETYSMELR